MKRTEIAALLKEDPNTEFAVARYERTKGLDAGAAYFVIIKSADPAKRRVHQHGHFFDEDKATGVEVFYTEDAMGYPAGQRKVVQPQDIVGTRADYEARNAEKSAAREQYLHFEQDERDHARRIIANLMNATGFVGADLLWAKHRAPGNRASIEITLEMAESIIRLVDPGFEVRSKGARLSSDFPVFEPDASDIAAMSDRDFR